MKAKAKGLGLPISTKHTVEVARNLRKKPIAKAMSFLQKVIEKKKPVQFKRFNKHRAHRKKIGPGAYPVKTCSALMKLIKSAMNNAMQKGMNPGKLVISKIDVGMAVSKNKRANRRMGRQTNITIEVTESD